MQVQGNYIPAGSTVYNSSAAEETRQIKASAGHLHALTVTNFNASARYVYIFDSLTATGTPIMPPIPLRPLGEVGSVVAIYLPFAIPFTTGCFVATSSTGATYTASAGSDIRMSAVYK